MIECEIDDCYVWVVELFVDFMMLMIGAMFMHKIDEAWTFMKHVSDE